MVFYGIKMKIKYILYLLLMPAFLIFFSSCSKKSDQEYWSQAVQAQKNEKYKQAADNYEKLADEFPESELSPKALFEAGKLYQSNAIKEMDMTGSMKKSLALYRKIIDKYPGSREAPEAMFMTGFIESNELGDYNAATQTFKLFLEKYPNHEMASSARAELDNMGLSPEEIVAKKLKAKK